jgi:hypothetical protein
VIKPILSWTILFSLLLPCALSQDNKNTSKLVPGTWVAIFNGKDLEGWTPKFTGYDLGVNYKNTFRVENGLLKVSYDQYDHFNGEFGHLFYKEKLSNYRIRVEYRFVGKQIPGGPDWGLYNNGIMIHCQSPQSMTRNQEFPVSIEAQILGDDGSGKRTTGNVCSPGTNIVLGGKLITEHCVRTSSKAIPPEQWATMEVEVHGSTSIKHIVNGEVVSAYEKPQLDPTDPDAKSLITGSGLLLKDGYIALQAETHSTEFRKVELMVLDSNSDPK